MDERETITPNQIFMNMWNPFKSKAETNQLTDRDRIEDLLHSAIKAETTEDDIMQSRLEAVATIVEAMKLVNRKQARAALAKTMNREERVAAKKLRKLSRGFIRHGKKVSS